MDRRQVKLPVSSRDILKLFTLSRTNQILRGRSPILEGVTQDKKGWTELVASEILSAKVEVVPKPHEFNVNLVSSDPRKGRYEKKTTQSHLCKTIRQNIISGILHKYHLIEAKVDHGKKRKKLTKKELEAWKLKRAQGLEGWKRKGGKKRKRRVVSSKRKKFQKYQSCTTCGDFHFKRICSGKSDLKVNLLVRQINQKADVIQQNMKDAWDKLDKLEATYANMLQKTYRLQSNRVCIEVLSGIPGDGHPDKCPCAEQKRKEAEMIEAKEKEEALEKRKAHQDELEKERLRREQLIEKRKQRFYQSLKKAEEKAKPQIISADCQKDLAQLDSKRSSLMKTMDQISDFSSKILQKQPDLIVMDGRVKTVTKEWIEEGGMIYESLKIDSLPDFLEKEEEVLEEPILDDQLTIQDDLKSLDSEDEVESIGKDEEVVEKKPRATTDAMPFDKFLDYMEIF